MARSSITYQNKKVDMIFFLMFVLVLFSFSLSAQELETEDEIILLPDVEVTETRECPEEINQEKMERNNATDLWEAVRYVPGVILSGGGAHNDSNFLLRGFGSDSVPIYIDGIAVANPFRGEGDAGRLLIGDYESIEIQKGYTSSLFGANTLGGAVMMRTAKPQEKFEASLKTALNLDSVFKYASSMNVLSVGTKQDLFYGKAVFQYRDIDHYRLPDSFEPIQNNPQQNGDRLWSDSKDLKLTLIAGLTPISDIDTWITYVFQNADKGFSPPDAGTTSYQIWNWTKWQRHSVSLNSIYFKETENFGIFSVKFLGFFDKYDNRLDVYRSWNTYIYGIHDPHSDYDEYSLGGRISSTWEINDWNKIGVAVTYKKDDHKGLRGGKIKTEEMTEDIHVNEDTWSLGTEYTIKPWLPLALNAGFGFDILVPIEYYSEENDLMQELEYKYYLVKSRMMLLYTWQFGVFFDITNNHQLYITYARKNHFPSMSDRYSTRFGDVLPNSNLGPEIANHFEVGYRGSIAEKLNINAAVYYSILEGKIVHIQIPNPNYASALVNYARNLDKTAYWGFELSPEIYLNDYLSGGAAFSWNKYTIEIVHSEDVVNVLPYYPEIIVNAYLEVKPIHKASQRIPWLRSISLIPRFEYLRGYRRRR